MALGTPFYGPNSLPGDLRLLLGYHGQAARDLPGRELLGEVCYRAQVEALLMHYRPILATYAINEK